MLLLQFCIIVLYIENDFFLSKNVFFSIDLVVDVSPFDIT